METSILLAQFWGWLLVIACTIYLFKREPLWEELHRLAEDRGFTLLSGWIALILGLVTVLLHNAWIADWRVVITIFGWLSLVKGIVRLGFPSIFQKVVRVYKSGIWLTRGSLAICILLGAWLIWASW
jgi:hypothetical protein